MDPQSDNRTKSWLYRLRYLKMFKNENTIKDTDEIKSPNETRVTFQRSIASSSCNEVSPELKKNETNLRRSLRKWHKRMKNCFSKNSKHLSRHETPSSLLRISVPEQLFNSNASLTPSPSRLTAGTDSQPRSPTFSLRSYHFSDATPKNEVSTLAHHVWYWGPVSKSLVEAKLHGAPDGSFLVRDSASDRHIFSISFRSVGKTLHVRIERTNSGYRVFDHKGFATVKELIEEAVKISSEEGLFCYTKSRGDEPNYPVRLLKPISRYDEVRSLQNLSRFVIRQHINVNDIEKLSLPSTLISFLKEENYF